MSKKEKTPCVRMSWRDMNMDQPKNTPTNPLPIKCIECGFPDMDFVPTPYLLTKAMTASVEMALAMRGNFLVRERVRQILEIAVPDACKFYPSAEAGSKKPAPWYLAVPQHKLKAFYPPPSRSVCPKCRTPREGDLDEFHSWKKMKKFDSGGIDIFKTLAWGTWIIWERGRPSRRDCRRDLYFSARLDELLTRAKVKAHLCRDGDFFKVKPDRHGQAWILEKLKQLAEKGLLEAPNITFPKVSAATRSWFKRFLKTHSGRPTKHVDFVKTEAKHHVQLPADYKQFISTVGPMPFRNVIGVEEMEDTKATVLLPEKFDFKNFRRGKVPNLEGEDAERDGVMFANTDFGDCFLFDVSQGNSDYPVYWYRHEENAMEFYASNFAECIQRFARRR